MLCSLLQVHYWFNWQVSMLCSLLQVHYWFIDFIGKLVCYAVYYKYIIDLTAS